MAATLTFLFLTDGLRFPAVIADLLFSTLSLAFDFCFFVTFPTVGNYSEYEAH